MNYIPGDEEITGEQISDQKLSLIIRIHHSK